MTLKKGNTQLSSQATPSRLMQNLVFFVFRIPMVTTVVRTLVQVVLRKFKHMHLDQLLKVVKLTACLAYSMTLTKHFCFEDFLLSENIQM